MCVGPLKRVFHWGPIFALSIVKCVSLSMWHCSTMWWPPFHSSGGFLNMALFSMWNALTLYHFFSAMMIGPGYLPLDWKPENIAHIEFLQYCKFCNGYKAPRAHHCRKCNRCVMKMDHHCPWINNCCGHRNHTHFTLFLLCAVCGCFQASIVLACSLYRALHRRWYLYYGTGEEPIVILGLFGFVICTFALGMALGVVIAVGTLVYFQVKGILKNETAIESWIVAKANHKRRELGTSIEPFVYPYNLGWKRNFALIFNWDFKPDGDGIQWPVVPECNQYTLTYEQMQQKEDKRSRKREYAVVEKYSGRWFPVSKGLKVCFSVPCSDESRIRLEVGDRVMVTRWKKHWMYGERIIDEHQYSTSEVVRYRGWFPRRCTVEIVAADTDFPNIMKQKKVI